MTYDVTITGGGIVGLATAYRLLEERPGLKLLLLEKEPRLAANQTGNNSGVLHSGLYYRPGSDKAALAVSGLRQMLAFCREQGVPHEQCGKIVVAVSQEQLPAAGGVSAARQRKRPGGPAKTGRAADRRIRTARGGRRGDSRAAGRHRGLRGRLRKAGGAHPSGRRRNPPEHPRGAVHPRRRRLDGRHDGWRLPVEVCRHLRRPVRRPPRACLQAEADRQDRPLPRRILPPQARPSILGAQPDLPGARPEVPVSGRAFHAADRRRCGGRPQRGAGVRP